MTSCESVPLHPRKNYWKWNASDKAIHLYLVYDRFLAMIWWWKDFRYSNEVNSFKGQFSLGIFFDAMVVLNTEVEMIQDILVPYSEWLCWWCRHFDCLCTSTSSDIFMGHVSRHDRQRQFLDHARRWRLWSSSCVLACFSCREIIFAKFLDALRPKTDTRYLRFKLLFFCIEGLFHLVTMSTIVSTRVGHEPSSVRLGHKIGFTILAHTDTYIANYPIGNMCFRRTLKKHVFFHVHWLLLCIEKSSPHLKPLKTPSGLKKIKKHANKHTNR